jgi:hypothetical protein
MIKPISKLCATLLLAALLLTSFTLHAAEEENITAAKVLSLINPVNTYGVQIGDKLSRKLVLEIPASYKISESAFPKKAAKAMVLSWWM